MTKLRAGLIGLGMMGRNHARVLSSLEGVQLVGIADPTGGVAGAAPVGVPVVDSLKHLLNLGIDYAMVSTPTQCHLETALALAAAGIAKGSGEPNKQKVAKVTKSQIEEICKQKMNDLNARDMEHAARMVAGTARSMGIEVEG